MNPNKFFQSLVTVIFLLGLLAPSIYLMSDLHRVSAQSGSTTGTIVGKVRDIGGAVIAGAPVKVRQTETNLERTTDADEDGNYQFLQLPPGNYEVLVELEGFSLKKERVLINIGTTALVQMSLVPVGATETVLVEASTTTDPTKTESSVINGTERIDNLPINRRNFLDFALTSPRVTIDQLPAQGVAATSGLSFNGQSSRQNNVTIDGLDNNDSNVGTVRSTFSQEAVREFQVISDSYSAEFGRALGGVINIVTKGGTNENHGTVFAFLRNDRLSARNAFAETNPPFEQYQLGATIGGPIRKDKLFYFLSFERLSVKQNNIVSIPDEFVTSARRLGFGYVSNGAQAFGQGITTFLGRTDWQINPNHALTGRYNFGGSFDGNFEPFGALNDRSIRGDQRLKDNQIAISETAIFPNANLVNEFRFLFGTRNQDVFTDTQGPRVRIVSSEIGQIAFGRAIFLDQPRQTKTFQFVDNVSFSKGTNQFKFGVDYLRFQAENRLPNREQGSFTFIDQDLRGIGALLGLPGNGFFTALETFDPSRRSPEQRLFLTRLAPFVPLFANSLNFPNNLPLADLPIPNGYGQGFFPQESLSAHQNFLSLFFQSELKPKENFIIKAGVRYDLFRTQYYPTNSGNFSPRLALSYTPAKLKRTSFFATYGLFFGTPNIGPVFAVFPEPRAVQNQFLPESILTFARPTRNFPISTQIPANSGFRPQFSEIQTIQPDLKSSYTQQASAGVNLFLWNSTNVSLAYTMVRGTRLFGQRDINPVVRPIPGNGAQSQITGRLDPQLGGVVEYGTAYDSYFHSGSISVNRRLLNNFALVASYTYSKAIDTTSDYVGGIQEVEEVFNLRNERGLSVQDIRHRFVASGTWDLKYTRNKFLRDFSLSGILTLYSGKPYNLLAGVDLNNNQIFNDRPFIVTPAGRREPLGRNVGIAPNFANVDLRLIRTIPIGERYSIQLTAEVFNLLNRVNINQFNRVIPRNSAGAFLLPEQSDGRYIVTPDRYLSSFAPRLFQLGIRFRY